MVLCLNLHRSFNCASGSLTNFERHNRKCPYRGSVHPRIELHCRSSGYRRIRAGCIATIARGRTVAVRMCSQACCFHIQPVHSDRYLLRRMIILWVQTRILNLPGFADKQSNMGLRCMGLLGGGLASRQKIVAARRLNPADQQ